MSIPLWASGGPPPSPLDARLPPFAMTVAAAVEHYRTVAYDAEQRGEVAWAEELRRIAREVEGMDQRAFLRWYAMTVHPS